MKLASFSHNGVERIGVRQDDTHVIVLKESLGMLDLIRAGRDAAENALAAVVASAQPEIIPLEKLSWRPPIPNPGKIVGVAMNNSASNARKIRAPDHPAFFLKPPSCLIAHQDAIHVRPYYGSVHPEPELAVVIGREMRDVDAVDSMAHVFGYSIFNDITGNGMRADDLFHYWALYANADDPDKLDRREQHLSYAARYKGSDTFGCMGPWLVTADEIPDPDNLDVHCSIGDESIADDSTRYYNYKVAELLSYLSHFQTLMPGDIVSCGTAFRPSPGRKSIHHANLQNNTEPVTVSIAGLGSLLNTVVIDDKPLGQWRLPGQDANREVG